MKKVKLEHRGDVLAVYNEIIPVIDCEICGFAHKTNMLTQDEERNLYYGDNFYEGEKAKTWFRKEKAEHLQGLWDTSYKFELSILKNNELSIVDIGAGVGWFTWYCTKNNIRSMGIEPSESARALSLVPFSMFPDIETIYGYYNLRLSLVLEHISKPVEFLKGLKSHLDGRMLIIVPNEFNPLQKRMGGDWFVSEHHVNYFTPQGLRNCVEAAGYNVVWEGATFPMELFALLGFEYRTNPELGEKVHKFRLYFQKYLGSFAFKLYQLLYKKWGIGRELMFVIEKNDNISKCENCQQPLQHVRPGKYQCAECE